MTEMELVEGSTRPDGGGQNVLRQMHKNATTWITRRSDLLLTLLVPPVVLLIVFRVFRIDAPVGLVVGSLILFIASYAVVSYKREGALSAKDRLATVAVWLGGAIALVPLVSILWTIFSRGLSVAFADFPHFFIGNLATAGPEAPVTRAGVGNAIVGTVEECGLATLITVPIAILTALFLDEASRGDETLAGRALRGLAALINMVIDAMNGIPSIITALVVYLVWVSPHGVHGYSGVAAAVALTIMMLPVVTRAADENIRLVHPLLREASLALGSPRWRTSSMVVLPTVRAGLISSTILGVARGVGETAPTLFTAHGNPAMNLNPFSGSQGNLALNIYLLATSPAKNAVREGWGDAVVLVLFVGILFAVARFAGSGGSARRAKRKAFIARHRRSVAWSENGGQ